MSQDPTSRPTRPTFSLLFFASAPAEFERDKFDLFRQSTRFADERGFDAVWIPELHFHAFGGMFPNPALAAVVLAGLDTTRYQTLMMVVFVGSAAAVMGITWFKHLRDS